jgi:hypothetical protein
MLPLIRKSYLNLIVLLVPLQHKDAIYIKYLKMRITWEETKNGNQS